MDEKKIETTQKAIRKNAGEENAFVDLLNKETKELSDSFDSYLFYHGYRKESDTAREILDEVSKHFGGKWLVDLYKKYGLDWDKEIE